MITIWRELDDLCQILRKVLYVDRNLDAARRYIPQLRLILRKIRNNTLAIIAAEGRAIYHELCGDIRKALVARCREMELTKRLYATFEKGEFSRATKRYALEGRGKADLKKREAIIASLRHKLQHPQNVSKIAVPKNKRIPKNPSKVKPPKRTAKRKAKKSGVRKIKKR